MRRLQHLFHGSLFTVVLLQSFLFTNNLPPSTSLYLPTMQFCPACDNKLYMQIGTPSEGSQSDDTATSNVPLTLYCKHCPYKKAMDSTSTPNHSNGPGKPGKPDNTENNDERFAFDPCMSRSNYSSNHPLYFSTIVNAFTFDDPTLPCLTIPCQNAQCPSNAKGADMESEVLYVRYNDQDMKFMYLCKHCRQCWHTNDQGDTEVVFDYGLKR